MTTPTTTASPWPARCAYISAVIFTAASGLTNLAYGWQKGDTLATSLVWSGVAGAVSIVFALSWPALIRSVDARRWSATLISLVALTLSGAYRSLPLWGAHLADARTPPQSKPPPWTRARRPHRPMTPP